MPAVRRSPHRTPRMESTIQESSRRSRTAVFPGVPVPLGRGPLRQRLRRHPPQRWYPGPSPVVLQATYPNGESCPPELRTARLTASPGGEIEAGHPSRADRSPSAVHAYPHVRARPSALKCAHACVDSRAASPGAVRRRRRFSDHDTLVAVAPSPVFGVPEGSINKSSASSVATGWCSTPTGTTNISRRKWGWWGAVVWLGSVESGCRGESECNPDDESCRLLPG